MFRMTVRKIDWDKETPFVVNLHITKACNMKCKYCYGGFSECHSALKKEGWIKLIEKIALETEHLPMRRINFAGGEPMLIPYLPDLIQKCHELGMGASIITNGSLLTKQFIDENKGRLNCIGISIDELSEENNVSNGRAVRGKAITFDEYVQRCGWINEAGISLKVNTVIHKGNASQDFSGFLKSVSVDRWKVLRMLLIENENIEAKEMLPTDEMFEDFVARHKAYNPVVENDDEIQGAYVFVSPDGFLMDNTSGDAKAVYDLKSGSLEAGFAQLNFNQEAYNKRYEKCN